MLTTKTYVMGTQKNRLRETVLLSTQNMFKLIGKKITILRSKSLLHWTYVTRCNFDMENALNHTDEGMHVVPTSVFLKLSCYKGQISSSK